jgi:CubicO group peptidase (beta-lactamase class C family)
MKETTIAAPTPELDAFAAESMAEWKVPGLASAIVQDGETSPLSSWRGSAWSFAAAPTAPSTSSFSINPTALSFAKRDEADPIPGRTDLADGQ